MSSVEIRKRMTEGSPRARITDRHDLLFIHGRLAYAADLMAAVFCLAATALFYGLSAGTGSGSNNRRRAPRDS
jgi:hypothetical protein